MISTPPRHFRWILPPAVVGLTWILGFGLLDWLTGPELALSAFYLPGVALVAWFSGRKQAFAIACCAAAVWLFAELANHTRYSQPFVPYWNGAIRLTVFLITAFLTSEVRARQRTEAALREQDGILRSVLDSMGDGVVVIAGNGRVLAFNPAAEKLFGCNAHGGDALEWVRKVESRQQDGVDVAIESSSPLRLAVAGRLSGEREISLHLDGNEEARLLRLTALPLAARQGEAPGVVIVIADLTTRRNMEKRIAEASERQQRRIGQELHDGVCQHLVGVAFATGSLQNTLESLNMDVQAAAAGEIAVLINQAISEARGLAHGLYPASLNEGIDVALYTLAETTRERFDIACSVSIEGSEPRLDTVYSTHLYRIAQECISNACRHANPDCIKIALRHVDGHLRLQIHDNGKGIDPAQMGKGGIGINLMRHRASLMGGSVEIESLPGQGTSISCGIPVENFINHST